MHEGFIHPDPVCVLDAADGNMAKHLAEFVDEQVVDARSIFRQRLGYDGVDADRQAIFDFGNI